MVLDSIPIFDPTPDFVETTDNSIVREASIAVEVFKDRNNTELVRQFYTT
jgi:hypothetical protein